MILSREELVDEFGSTFEHSAWIAEAAFDTGAFQGVARSADGTIRLTPDEATRIHAAMVEAFRAAPAERRMAVLTAHPDLAGRLAIAELTDESAAEQTGAGLDRLTPDEHARFIALNERYAERFGHPFIVAVKGMDRHAILDAFERRVENEADEEFAEACAQVERIARLRLDARVAEPANGSAEHAARQR